MDLPPEDEEAERVAADAVNLAKDAAVVEAKTRW